jgi:hypothetical protein
LKKNRRNPRLRIKNFSSSVLDTSPPHKKMTLLLAFFEEIQVFSPGSIDNKIEKSK